MKESITFCLGASAMPERHQLDGVFFHPQAPQKAGFVISSPSAGRPTKAIDEVDLDTTGTAWFGDPVSMRWVLIHMIEDTVRHAGHMGIVRELIDGATGDHPPD
jgi:hypothetical protein